MRRTTFAFTDASGQSSTTERPPAPAPTTATPTSASIKVTQSTAPSQSQQPIQPSQTLAPSPASAAPTSANSTAAPTTEPTVKPTCAVLSFIMRFPWEEKLANTSSRDYKIVALLMPLIMKSLYNDSQKYEDIKVTELKFTKSRYSMVGTSLNLCLVVKANDGAYIEDVFQAKIKTGNIYKNFPVQGHSAEFEPKGVVFKDWKAKDGECDKCAGAAGEFVIEGTCEDKVSSCKGLKNTKMTKDCVTYCPSSAGRIEYY
ncbi:hypothetical protein ACROYT_G012712 [Oculina patagonica]